MKNAVVQLCSSHKDHLFFHHHWSQTSLTIKCNAHSWRTIPCVHWEVYPSTASQFIMAFHLVHAVCDKHGLLQNCLFYLTRSLRVSCWQSLSWDWWPPVVLSFQRQLLADQRVQWQKTLLQALRESKMILANTNTKDYRLNLYPYLCLLEDRDYVDIMIQVILNTDPSLPLNEMPKSQL